MTGPIATHNVIPSLIVYDKASEWADTHTLNNDLRNLTDALRYYSDDLKAHSDLAFIIDHHGKLDARATTKPEPATKDKGTSAQTPPFSASLIAQLETLQTLTVQQNVAADPDLALTLLLTSMVAAFYHDGSQSVMELTLRRPSLTDANDIAAGGDFALDDALAIVEAVERTDIGGAIAVMERDSKLVLLAALTALHLAPVRQGDAVAAIAPLGQCWKPDTGFYSKLHKGALISILEEKCGAAAADNCKKLKKSALAEQVHDRLADIHWLPQGVAS